MPGPTLTGLLLEVAGLCVAGFFWVPGAPRVSALAMIAALLFGATADLLMWTAIAHLGRQFRIQAGLYHDHQLVRSGPYAVVRHPIYASLLALTVATGALVARWPRLVAGVVLCIAGNEIRVRAEDRLLESRFGDEFRKYRKSVAAYVPFLR
jgi:protein-S-isoprenylcysteine O-methyltransferase Ste14